VIARSRGRARLIFQEALLDTARLREYIWGVMINGNNRLSLANSLLLCGVAAGL